MANAKKTEPQPSTFVKYDKKDGKKVVDKQTTANPALRNELLTSGYREEKPKATSSGSSGSNAGSNTGAGSAGAGK